MSACDVEISRMMDQNTHETCSDAKVKDTIATGEEDEDEIYSQRSKLYRFRDGEWKERGIGNAKLLKHKDLLWWDMDGKEWQLWSSVSEEKVVNDGLRPLKHNVHPLSTSMGRAGPRCSVALLGHETTLVKVRSSREKRCSQKTPSPPDTTATWSYGHLAYIWKTWHSKSRNVVLVSCSASSDSPGVGLLATAGLIRTNRNVECIMGLG